MKHSLILSLLSLVLLVFGCKKENGSKKIIPCIPNNLQNNVLAFYPFSNGSLDDLSGYNQHLTNSTTATSTSDRQGNLSCAYGFDNSNGSTAFLTTANTTFLNNLNEFSISLWYLPLDTTRTGGAFESLIHRDVGESCPNRNGQWSIALYDCRKAVFGRTNDVWDQDITNFDCQQEISNRTNTWTHLLATFNSNGNTMQIYRNGILQNTSTGNANCTSGVPNYQDIGDLFLGSNYTGKIDDIILLNKVLSPNEVQTLFALEACCDS